MPIGDNIAFKDKLIKKVLTSKVGRNSAILAAFVATAGTAGIPWLD